MNHLMQTIYRSMTTLLLIPALTSVGQDLEINWFTIDNGGGTVTGGGFELRGTIGQPDAVSADAALTGGDYVLTGGYWTGANVGGLVPGDCDGDGDVGPDDYTQMESCLMGPVGGIGSGCDCIDFDDNGQVDLRDFAAFQSAFTG